MRQNHYPECVGMVHTAKAGETLYSIGREYGVRVCALLFANPYTDLYQIREGDQICIPRKDSGVPKTLFS